MGREQIAWIDERLAEAGLERTGEFEEHSMRPWAEVFRIPSSGGPVWLKATGPESRFEVGLYRLLQRVAPDPFADLAPHGELVEELELACRVGKIARAMTWHRSVSAYAPDEVEERWLSGPAESLFSLLEDSWLGRA